MYARTSILAGCPFPLGKSNLSNHLCLGGASLRPKKVEAYTGAKAATEGRHGPAATYQSNRWLLHLPTDLYAAPAAAGVDAGGSSSPSVGGSSGGGGGGGGGGGDFGFNAVFAAMSPRRPPKTIIVLRGRASIEAHSGRSRGSAGSGAGA